jgi:hypothetical protein
MVANQRNFQVFTYTDNQGNVWNKRGEQDAAVNAIDGSTALTAGARMFPAATRRYHTRAAIFQDPSTFRTKRITIYTVAAFAALTGASTLAVNVPGNVAAVTYNLSQLIDEKKPVAKAARQLTDHA